MCFVLLVENSFVVGAADLLSDKFAVVVDMAVAISFVNSIRSFVVLLVGIVEAVE